MLFDKFCEVATNCWKDYFAQLEGGEILCPEGTQPVFPDRIVFSEFHSHYMLELVGARAQPLKPLKRRRLDDVHNSFDLFRSGGNGEVFSFEARGVILRNLLLSQEENLESVYARFPHSKKFETKIVRPAAEGALLTFKPDSSVIMEEVAIVNKRDNLSRCKQFIHAATFPRSVTAAEVVTEYERLFWSSENGDLTLHGVATIPISDAKMAVASQLQNLYIDPAVNETLIDDFISRNPDVLISVFGVESILSQVNLRWCALEYSHTKTIRPDFFLRGCDGLCDILDIKLAKVDRNKLVTDRRERRRFASPVSDGIAQLAHYRDYFNFPENREYAKGKFGIEVRDPRLTLVIGSSENLDAVEVAEAMRNHVGLNLIIIDYDTLVRAFLAH